MTIRTTKRASRLALVVSVAPLLLLAACGEGSAQTGTVTGRLLSLVSGPIDAGPKSLSGTLTAKNASGHVEATLKVPASGSYRLQLPAGSYNLTVVLDGGGLSCWPQMPLTPVKIGATTVANINCGIVTR